MSSDRVDNAEAYEDGGGGDKINEISALRKTVGAVDNTANAALFQRMDMIEQKQLETDKKLDAVLDKIEELSPAVTTEQLFPSGCVWDAYMFVCDLIRSGEIGQVIDFPKR